jgi:thioredoxin 1
MQETSIDHLITKIDSEKKQIVFIYTTMCGTCQLAKRMLEIVEDSIDELTISMLNISFMGNYSKCWKIESVPCLLIFKDREIGEKIYGFQSVDYLYRLLK